MAKLADLNAMTPEEFTSVLGGVFEHSPWIAQRAAAKRPFRDTAELLAALRDTVMKAGDAEKLALIRAHPDLVGNATLTRESQGEQQAAGLGDISNEEIAQFRKYNADYRERFGFPFIICARLIKKEAILAAFPVRLQNSKEREMEMALGEIFKIAELRLKDAIE